MAKARSNLTRHMRLLSALDKVERARTAFLDYALNSFDDGEAYMRYAEKYNEAIYKAMVKARSAGIGVSVSPSITYVSEVEVSFSLPTGQLQYHIWNLSKTEVVRRDTYVIRRSLNRYRDKVSAAIMSGVTNVE